MSPPESAAATLPLNPAAPQPPVPAATIATPPPPPPTYPPAAWTGPTGSAGGGAGYGGETRIDFSPQAHQHSFLVRALWYVFVGWWFGALVIVLGYLFTLTIIGMPVGFYLFNRVPQALTLRSRTVAYRSETREGVTYVGEGTQPQYPWLLRAVWFIVIGWWLGAVWLTLAWLIGLLIITLPISFLMYNRISGVMTLQRH